MKITENFVLLGISLLLIVAIYYWIGYLVKNNYIQECFQSNQTMMGPEYSHSVDLPLTTTYSCKNFCGPPARCSITGQQCTSDIDCPGCQPYVPPLPPSPKSSLRPAPAEIFMLPHDEFGDMELPPEILKFPPFE